MSSKYNYNIRESLVSLVRVVYGLAIVSGLKTSMDYLFSSESKSDYYVVLIIVTFIIGISDWLGYHSLCAPIPYRNVYWTLADVSYPVIIFILFYLSRCFWWFRIILSFYFLAWVFYNYIWIKSSNINDQAIKRYNLFSQIIFVMSIIPIFFGKSPEIQSECCCIAIIATTCIFWAITNIQLVNWYIKNKA